MREFDQAGNIQNQTDPPIAHYGSARDPLYTAEPFAEALYDNLLLAQELVHQEARSSAIRLNNYQG
jgi:hypothetical protein